MAKKAFIIGKNTGTLKYAESDADLIQNCLTRFNYEIVAPKAQQGERLKTIITESFDDFIEATSETDTVIFYFAGHGHLEFAELALVLGNPERVSNLLEIGYITRKFASCKAKDKLIILDCCKAKYVNEDWESGQRPSDQYRILIASKSLETRETDEYKAGVLTFLLHRALTEAVSEIADDAGSVRINSLHTWLETEVVKRLGKSKRPILSGDKGADFEFGVVEKTAHSPVPKKAFHNLLHIYLRNLLQHNEMPVIVTSTEKLPPPISTEVYVDLRAREDRPDVAEKLAMEKNLHRGPEDHKSFTKEYAQLPEYSEEFGLHSEKLSKTFKTNRCLMFLGDPGSGKTTFLKYITHRFAQTIMNDIEGFFEQAQLSKQNDVFEDDILGKVFLPIRIPIRHFADQRTRDRSLSFADYVPKHFFSNEWNNDKASDLKVLFAQLLKVGECIFLLDGLDEVVQDEERRHIALELSDFIHEHLQTGNRFVLTSRIPGYRYIQHVFSPICKPYLIEPMNEAEVAEVIRKLALVIEAKIAPFLSEDQIHDIAEKKVSEILNKRRTSHPIAVMSSNPLLCGLLTTMHPNIPSIRTDLYKETIKTLLIDWPLRKEITLTLNDRQLTVVLNDLAYWIHENKEKRYITADEIKARFVEALDRNEYPGISCTAEQLLQDFLTTAHKETGVFEERGIGLYGFPHLGFEEYFAACWITGNSEKALDRILGLLHQARWREPTLMAVSMAPYQNLRDWLIRIFNSNSRFESVLHRDLLFTADCISEGMSVDVQFQKIVFEKLVSVYVDRHGKGRYKLLRMQIREALLRLVKLIPVEILYTSISQLIKHPASQYSRKAVLEILEWLIPFAPEKIQEFRGSCSESWLCEINRLCYSLQQNRFSGDNGWKVYRNESKLLLLLGLFCISDLKGEWRNILESFSNLGEDAQNELDSLLERTANSISIVSAEKALKGISDASTFQDPQQVQLIRNTYDYSPDGSLVEEASYNLLNADLTDEELQIELQRLRDGVELLQTHIGSTNVAAAFMDIGQLFIDHLVELHSISDRFNDTAQRLPDFESDIEFDPLQYDLEASEAELISDILLLLQRTTECARYYEAVLFLEALDDQTVSEEVTNILRGDLGANGRLECVLYTLSRLPLTGGYLSEYDDLLLDLLSETSSNITPLLLDVVFKHSVNASLLEWSWDILRDPDHHLHLIVRNCVQNVDAVQGTRETLATIITAIHEPSLQRYGFKLLYHFYWTEETLPNLIGLLFVENPGAQHLAALQLATFVIDNEARNQESLGILLRSLLGATPYRDTFPTSLTVEQWKNHGSFPEAEAKFQLSLSEYDLDIQSSHASLAELIFREPDVAGVAAIVIILYSDFHLIVLERLLDGVSSTNDRIRSQILKILDRFVRGLPTDGSTKAIQAMFDKFMEANNQEDGYLATILTGLVQEIDYQSEHWINKWVGELIASDSEANQIAELAISSILRASAEVRRILLQYLQNKTEPVKLRESIAEAFNKMFYYETYQYGQIAVTALEQALADEDDRVRSIAAEGLRRSTTRESLWHHVGLLHDYISVYEGSVSQYYALKSLGKLLCKSREIYSDKREEIKQIETELLELVKDHGASSMEWKGAAVALANLYHGLDERIDRLSRVLHNDPRNILEILLLANAETDQWIYDLEQTNDEYNAYYEWEVNQIITWIAGISDLAIRDRLANFMLDILAREAEEIRERVHEQDDEGLNPFTGWPLRRITIIILAELIHKAALSPSVLTNYYKKEDVQRIFVTIAKDPDSFNARRFAIRILGELQQFTSEIAETLFAGHLDTEVVYIEAYNAVRKFVDFEPESIQETLTKIDSPSAIQAGNAALLLGRVGASLSLENQVERNVILEKLHLLLTDSKSKNHNHDLLFLSPDFTGSLHDIIFESLYQIVSGKDSNRWLPNTISTGFLNLIAKGPLLDIPEIPSRLNIRIIEQVFQRDDAINPFKALSDLNALRRQAQQMLEELASNEVSVVEGEVEVIITGDQKILSVTMASHSQEHLLSALNRAIKQSQKLAAQKLQSMTGSLGGIPGDLNNLRQQAQQMQEELASNEVSVVEGVVEVIITGDQKILSVTVAGQPQEHLLSPLNQAIKGSQELAAQKLQSQLAGIMSQ